jgi:sensor histidine kinase YesM
MKQAMSTVTTTDVLAPTSWRGLLKKLGRDARMLLVINTGCALIGNYVLHIAGGLWENWVFSMCIGTLAFLIINSSSYLIWGETRLHRPAYYLLCLAAAPIALFGGNNLASWLFGYPLLGLAAYRSAFGLGTLGFTVVVSLLTSWFYWNRSRVAQLIAAAETEKARSAAIEKQALQAQLQLLQAQIEPHMLFNTLANLQILISVDQTRDQHMLEQLIQFLRASLSASRAEQATLQQEFRLIRAYLELMAIRMGKRLSYTLELPDHLQDVKVAPMLLQPLVENAIKHGLEPKMEGGAISVQVVAEPGALRLRVADTGLGLAFDYEDKLAFAAEQEGGHVGNANIRDRIVALYGSQAALTLSANEPCGTIAELHLPLSL